MANEQNIASASVQCIFIKDGEQYNSKLMCATGDLQQRYSGSVGAPQIPADFDFTKTKPILQVIFTSADPDIKQAALQDQILNDSTFWWANGEKLSFGEDGLSKKGLFESGTFKRIKAKQDATAPFGGLQMMKNLVSQCGGVPVVIRNDLGFTTLDDQAMTRTESYVIDIKRFSGDGCEAEVYTDTTFVLDGKTTSTLCRCRLWEGAEKVFDTKAGKAAAGGKTVRWYLYDDATDDWKERTAGVDANGELTITTEDVKTYLQVMAAVFSSADEHDYRKADAHDIQEIFDKTDALMINPNPTPANLTLRRGETDPDGVTLAPTTYDRDTEKALTGVKYKFVCYSPSGTILNGTTSQGMGYDSPTHGQQGVADNTELLTSYKVPRTMFEALGEGPRVDIRAFK